MTGVLIKKANLDTETHIGRMACEQEDSHLQAKEKGLEHTLPSQSSEGTNSTNTH